jgi:ATP-dependent DNA ligase
MLTAGATWDGELVCYKNGKALDRKTSNGIINKAVKGTISDEEADWIRFIAWDVVDFTSTIPYDKRLAIMNEAFANVGSLDNSKILPCHTEIVNNQDEAIEFFMKMLSQGEEGAILKNMHHVWQPKRTKDLGKMKAEEEADLVVVGWNEGTGKYKGYMGSLECETADGLLSVNVSGWSDHDRKTLTEENTKGKILTVMYNAIIDSKGKDKKSLFLPRAVEFRFDKTVANKLEDLK